MKKVLSLMLAMVLAFTLLAVPAGAKTTYTYKPYTYTDEYGDVYTFSAASAGYDIHYSVVDNRYHNSVIILKPDSTVTAKKGQGGDGLITYGMWDDGIGDAVGGEGKYGTWAVEKIYDYHVNEYGYSIDDVAAALSKGNIATFFIMESAAEAHSDMITLAGEKPPKPKVKGLVLTVDDSSEFSTDNGYYYNATLTNSSDEPISGHYALVSYKPSMYNNWPYTGPLFLGQAHPFTVDLQPGQSIKQDIKSSISGLSSINLIWVKFEDKAEQDAFFADNIFGMCSDSGKSYAYYPLDMIDGPQWMKDIFGVNILPAK